MGKKKGRRHRDQEVQASEEQADDVARQELQETASDDEEDISLYDPQNVLNRPAYDTKHLEELEYNVKELSTTLRLRQSSLSGSTSTSLWLSSQVMAAFLCSPSFESQYLSGHLTSRRHGRKRLSTGRTEEQERRPVAIELGAGTGLSSILLSKLGYDTVVTDTESSQELLQHNVEENIAKGDQIRVGVLDWRLDTETQIRKLFEDRELNEIKVDLVVATDTLYAKEMVLPFFETFRHLLSRRSQQGGASSPTRGLLALERRDGRMIDEAFDVGRGLGLVFERIELGQIVRRSLNWSDDVWEGVEVWKVGLSSVQSDTEQTE